VNPLKADYFDGKDSTRHPVSVLVSGGKLKVVGRDVSEEFDARGVRRSLRIADTPRWLYLPGGGVCVTSDNDAVDRITRDRSYELLLHRWESRPVFAVISIALVAAVFGLLIFTVLPIAAGAIAERIPVGAEAALGRKTLAGMEEYLLQPSRLLPARQKVLREKFDRLARGAGETTPYRLEFRASAAIGPNAFALPSGIIVVTDELVNFSTSDNEVLAVLAHELGHVRHRHTMRRLLESSAAALVVAGVTGDITSASSLAASAPTLLLQAKYSRDNEREADRYAIDLLRRRGVDPRYLTTLLARLETDTEKHGQTPRFLSSHPPTAERQALAGQGTPAVDPAEARERAAALDAPPDRPKLNPTDPVQGRVMALLELRDYGELELIFTDYQKDFEKDGGSGGELENAYAVMRDVRRGSEAFLDEWVRTRRSSYAALVARANFYYWQAWDVRGSGTMQDVPPEQAREMRAYLARAKADLERSVKLAGKPYMSHLLLMSVARTSGDRAAEKTHYLEAIKLAPDSASARLLHMRSLEPRWGGSYKEMEAFLAETRQQVKNADTIARVAAQIPEYRAMESARDKNYEQAMRYYDEAIALHPGANARCERAYALDRLGRGDEALKEVRLGLAAGREERYCLDLAVSLAAKTADEAAAVALLTDVIEVDVSSTAALNQRGMRYVQAGKPDLALNDFKASAGLGDAHGSLEVANLYWSGTGVAQDREEAAYWYRKAAAAGNLAAQAMLDKLPKIAEKTEGAARP
jgi:Zn-dependent protease with chaperone function